MSKREYSDPSGSGHKIEITSDGTDVRVRVVSIDHDCNEYGGMVDMPINDLRDMFKEADEEERARRAVRAGFRQAADRSWMDKS